MLRTPFHAQDEVRFGVRVGVAVGAELVGEVPLELAVPARGLRMGAQIIPELDVTVPPPRVRAFHEMDVVHTPPSMCPVEKTPESQLFLELRHVLVADAGKLPDAGGRVSQRPHPDHDVDNRLRGETGDGGATDVLYLLDVCADHRLDTSPLLSS